MLQQEAFALPLLTPQLLQVTEHTVLPPLLLVAASTHIPQLTLVVVFTHTHLHMLVAVLTQTILHRLVTVHLLTQQVLTPTQAAQPYGVRLAMSQGGHLVVVRLMARFKGAPAVMGGVEVHILALGTPSVPSEAVDLEPLTTTELTCVIAGHEQLSHALVVGLQEVITVHARSF
jgi:hypothetical protein